MDAKVFKEWLNHRRHNNLPHMTEEMKKKAYNVAAQVQSETISPDPFIGVIIMLGEEQGELYDVISKAVRGRTSKNPEDNYNIYEELADNYILLGQIEKLFGIDHDIVEHAIDVKLYNVCGEYANGIGRFSSNDKNP